MIFCSGKLYYALEQRRRERASAAAAETEQVALVRLEVRCAPAHTFTPGALNRELRITRSINVSIISHN